MTLKNDRHKAELAVIAAARGLGLSDTDDGMAECKWDEATVLRDAIDALDALPLVAADKAPVSRGAPLTSQNASAFMAGPRAASLSARIVRSLARVPFGMTVEELCDHLNGRHQSVSARVHELRDNGWIAGSDDDTRTNRSGSEAIVWRLTQAARWYLNGAKYG